MKAIHLKRFLNYVWRIAFVIVLLVAGIKFWPEGFLGNLYPEIISVIATILLLDQLAADREKRRELDDLIRDMGSELDQLANRAVVILRDHGYLANGALKGCNFTLAKLNGARLGVAPWLKGGAANLQETSFMMAYLADAWLVGVNFRKASLSMAHLEKATLDNAFLENASLDGANLQGASLAGAHLEDATLRETNLCGANLCGAYLRGAHLEDAVFDRETLMPDCKDWTPETEVIKFTWVHHREFFDPDTATTE